MGTDQPLVWGMSRHPRLLGAKHWAWCRWRHLSTCLATENMYDSPSRLGDYSRLTGMKTDESVGVLCRNALC